MNLKLFFGSFDVFLLLIHTNMQGRYRQGNKEVKIEDKIIMIELQSVTPSSQLPMLIRWDLSDIDS